MKAIPESESYDRKRNSDDAFVDYMLLNLQMTEESANQFSKRQDEGIRTYITVFSATLGALVLVIAAVQQSRHLVFAALGTAAVILGVVGAIASITYANHRKKRLALRNSLHELHLFFEEIAPTAFTKFGCGVEKSDMIGWWASDTPILVLVLANCVLLAVGVGLLACAFVLASPTMSLSANLWWIALLTILLAVVVGGVLAGQYRRIMSHSAEP